MKNPTNEKSQKPTENAEKPTRITIYGDGETIYLEDLEENGPPGHDWQAAATCCGGPVAVVWLCGYSSLLICCERCHLVLVRVAIARRPLLAARAGAAIDGGGAE